ncbi:MAG: hypothetical protein LBD97_01460 [Bifidobacteriaceae bacterium]|nr:hypothetical protein [Bifidobacteriaceae bacterium]
MGRAAILIGIDQYSFLSEDQPGPAEAAEKLAEALRRADPGGWGPTVKTVPAECGPVSAEELNESVADGLSGLEDSDELLFYFAGFAFNRGHDLLLAASDHRPYQLSGSELRLSWLLDQVRARNLKNATIILDCFGGAAVQAMNIPRGTVVLANTQAGYGWPRQALSNALAAGLDGPRGTKKGQARAWDQSGQVTTLSWFMSAISALATDDNWEPIVQGSLSGAATVGWVEILQRAEMLRLPKLFPQREDGSHTATLSPEMEWPHGIGVDQIRKTLKWGDDPKVEAAIAAVEAKGKEFGFHSRPLGYSAEDRHAPEFEPEQDMELIKKLRDAGLLESIEPYSDLFWSCLSHGTAKLNDSGVALWKIAEAEAKHEQAAPADQAVGDASA